MLQPMIVCSHLWPPTHISLARREMGGCGVEEFGSEANLSILMSCVSYAKKRSILGRDYGLSFGRCLAMSKPCSTARDQRSPLSQQEMTGVSLQVFRCLSAGLNRLITRVTISEHRYVIPQPLAPSPPPYSKSALNYNMTVSTASVRNRQTDSQSDSYFKVRWIAGGHVELSESEITTMFST